MGFFIIYLIPTNLENLRVGPYEKNIFDSIIVCYLKLDVYIGKPNTFRKIAAGNSSDESIRFRVLNPAAWSIGELCRNCATDDAGGAITATINGVVYNLAVPTFNTIDFVGFTSDTPITSVAFTEQGYGIDITQFILDTANSTTSVPEPASMLLLGLGLMGLAGVKRKLKK
jgi:hypothetical protein